MLLAKPPSQSQQIVEILPNVSSIIAVLGVCHSPPHGRLTFAKETSAPADQKRTRQTLLRRNNNWSMGLGN
jgi:hypothetical protein